MISTKISYILGCSECFLYAGSVFGWSFLEYIMKQEGIFLNLCDDQFLTKTQNETVFCNRALQEYVNVFSWMLVRKILVISYYT